MIGYYSKKVRKLIIVKYIVFFLPFFWSIDCWKLEIRLIVDYCLNSASSAKIGSGVTTEAKTL